MRYLLFALGEVLPAAGILLLTYLVLHRLWFRDVGRTAVCCLFSIYLCVVYTLVGLPNAAYVRFDLNVNLIPFAGFLNGLRDNVLNVLLFVPLGAFLPLLWDRFRRMKRTVLFGFGISLVIEAAQMFTYRATDVNDLITNTLGTLLGFFLGNALRKAIPLQPAKGRGEQSIVFGTAVCIMFVLQPFVLRLL